MKTILNTQPQVRWFQRFLDRRVIVTAGLMIGFLCLISVTASICSADETEELTAQQAAEFFEQKVKPILEKNCFECHGSGEKVRAEFVLTNREDLLKGGESGKAIDAEDPNESLFLKAINYEDYEMPPKGKLPQAQIDILTRWVKLGAPWKGDGFRPKHVEKEMAPVVNAQAKNWWAYRSVASPDIPKVRDDSWIRNEVDNFLLHKLENAGLKPNPPASKRVLIRRAFYDLTGLPPTPQQVAEFENDSSQGAFEKVIDRLLESPEYGEKWGRHWLDLVRYAESNSYERDGTKPFVWRYRDYVIRSFNEDKPYDQFIKEQLAGDELDKVTSETIVATGFYRLGKWDDEPVDAEQAWYDDADDILTTTTTGFLGMTLNCARCHDHKIDPIPQTDYYRVLSFFRNIRRYGIRSNQTVEQFSVREIGDAQARAKFQGMLRDHQEKIATNQKELESIEAIVKKDFIPVEFEEFKHERNRVALVRKRIGKKIDGKEFTDEQSRKYQKLTQRRNQLRNNPPKPFERALCIKEESPNPKETFVTIRGNAHARGEVVQPGFPIVLSPPEPKIKKPSHNESTGRRRALAEWIASKENPLTARVMVNRIWQHHFGRGIVRSASDFGYQSTPPTHPELLDWLASEFMNQDWRMKKIHKLIMLSNAYQMSSAQNKAAYEKDPINDLFWRFNMRRLTAEEVRDSILAVSNNLNLKKFGPSIYPVMPAEVLQGQSRPGAGWNTSKGAELDRRSIYIHTKRSLPVPLLANFDVADPDSSCAVRFNTTQPSQALTMLNSDYVNQQAKRFADYLKNSNAKTDSDRVKLALSRCLQRNPTDQETERGVKLIKDFQSKDQLSYDDSLRLFCLVTVNMNEFIYLD